MSDEDRNECASCGSQLSEMSGLPLDQRLPCPNCGSLSRVIDGRAGLAGTGTVRRGARPDRGDPRRGQPMASTLAPILATTSGMAEGLRVGLDRGGHGMAEQLGCVAPSDHLGVLLREVAD